MQVYRYFFQGRFRDTTGINDWEHAGIYFDQYPLVWYCIAVVMVCLQIPALADMHLYATDAGERLRHHEFLW